MPLWTCSTANCLRPAVRNAGDCVICGQHLCIVHVQNTPHLCPVWNDGDVYDEAAATVERQELQGLLSQISTKALAARASELRGGIACTVPTPVYDKDTRSAVMGGMNYDVDVTFDDGIVWVARIRRHNCTSPPRAVGDYIIESEVATLRFLADRVPAARTPRVYSYALPGSGSPVGAVGYILMEKLPGRSLRWSLPNAEQRRHLMGQLADVFIELSQHEPLRAMGSLSFSSSTNTVDVGVGPAARESFMDLHSGELLQNGPFASALECHQRDIALVLDRILRGELYPVKRVDAYLVHLFLRDVAALVAPAALPSNEKNARFYIKHADDKRDHLLVDDDYNLTGIIDWEWAYTAPAAVAFNSPIGLLDVAQFYDSINRMCDDEAVFAQLLAEKGRADLAGHVRASRVQHFFAFCCDNNMETDWAGFLGLFRGLRETAGVDAELDWAAWREKALAKYSGDGGLKQLLA